MTFVHAINFLMTVACAYIAHCSFDFNTSYIHLRRIQNPVKREDGALCEKNSSLLSAINYLRKKLHLRRLTVF